MTEDSRSTSAGRLKGSVKEAIGKRTGDVRIEAEGQRQKRRARRAEAAGTAESGSGTGGPEWRSRRRTARPGTVPGASHNTSERRTT